MEARRFSRPEVRPRPAQVASLASLASLLAVSLVAGCGQPKAARSRVTINVIDAAGSLAVLQQAIESYQAHRPDAVERFTFTKAPAPELPGKLRAMQAAGHMDVDLVLGGTDILAAGIEQGLWTPILPDHADRFSGLDERYADAAREMQKLARGQALAVVYMPAGPLLEYNPDKVKDVPTTPAALLAWCKAHPNRFIYARPANSGPGRTFLMGLPYLLGDKDAKDPVSGWDKTWAFLNELDSCVEYYPSGTTAVMKELGEGSRDLTVTVTGWDLNARALGIVPAQFKVGAFTDMTWVNDTQYLMAPRGLSPQKLAVVLDLMSFLLQPEQQALTFDKGYFYPGPAIKGVTLAMAPEASQRVIKQFGRPEYEQWFKARPHERPLDAQKMVAAFRRWDEEIGAKKGKR
jgi:putative spermidine/putrescine transport system substrate-binding protein